MQHQQDLNPCPAWGLGFVLAENKVDNPPQNDLQHQMGEGF